MEEGPIRQPSRPLEGLSPVQGIAGTARTHTEEAVDLIARVMRDQRADLKLRLLAAEMLLDRGWGKPPVAIGLQVAPPAAPNLEVPIDPEPGQEGRAVRIAQYILGAQGLPADDADALVDRMAK